jgi:peroxiredoxin (alkyl hydroperoxide reductase subunit C)
VTEQQITGLTPLPVGTNAPAFSLRDQNNEVVSLANFAGQRAVLMVFYPFAFTNICTGELGQVQSKLAEFANDRVQVLTISIDSPYSHKVFAQRDGLDFPLLADFWPHGGVAQRYGVFNDAVGAANRGTFLVDRQGVIRFSEANEIGQGRDPQAWLDAIAALGSQVG